MPVNPTSALDLTLWSLLQTGGARAINNTAGTLTATGAQKLRWTTFDAQRLNPVNRPKYKTGKRSQLKGARGRQGATWTLAKEFFPSGAAGTAPEDSNILQAIFGPAGTVVSSTSVTYPLTDALNYLTLLRYNNTPGLTGATHLYVLGGIPQRVRFILNQEFLMYEIQGTAVGMGDSVTFSAYTGSQDAVLGGGLTTYPAEPGAFTQLGDVIQGFGGGAGVKFGGSALAELRGNAEIVIDLGVKPIADAMNDAYPIGFIGGRRTVTLSNLECVDSDGSVLNALKTAAQNKTPGNFIFQFGTVAGSIVTFNVNNVQVGEENYTENDDALDIKFGDSGASASSATTTDEASLVLT